MPDLDLDALRNKLAFAKRFAHEGWPDGYVGVSPEQAAAIIAALEDRDRLREADKRVSAELTRLYAVETKYKLYFEHNAACKKGLITDPAFDCFACRVEALLKTALEEKP